MIRSQRIWKFWLAKEIRPRNNVFLSKETNKVSHVWFALSHPLPQDRWNDKFLWAAAAAAARLFPVCPRIKIFGASLHGSIHGGPWYFFPSTNRSECLSIEICSSLSIWMRMIQMLELEKGLWCRQDSPTVCVWPCSGMISQQRAPVLSQMGRTETILKKSQIFLQTLGIWKGREAMDTKYITKTITRCNQQC